MNKSKETKTIDEILLLTGGYGRFQILLSTMMAYCMITFGLQALTMTFISAEPPWKCDVSSDVCNTTAPIKFGMPMYKSRCKMDKSDWLFVDSFTSIITEFDLVCERSILKNVATSMVYLGWFLGAIIFGILSDTYGRKRILMVSMLMMGAAGIISSFVKIFWLFAVLKVVVGWGLGGAVSCVFILNTEFAGIKKRAFVGIVIWNFWIVGLCLTALLAYLIKDWRYLNLATSAPAVIVLLFASFIPESPRWYIVHGRLQSAEALLRKVAKFNNVTYPENVSIEQPTSIKSNLTESKPSALELFTNIRLAIYNGVCLGIWFTCSMTYYGISLSSGSLGGNIYLVFFLTSIITFPGNILATYLIDRFGRKKILIISLILAAIGMVGAGLMPIGNRSYTIPRVTLAMTSKLLITIAFDAAYLITFEIFPTTLRNAAMGFASAAARVGSMSASYIIYLKRVNTVLPFLIFAAISITIAIASSVLPETNNTPTKEIGQSEEDTEDKEKFKMTIKDDL